MSSCPFGRVARRMEQPIDLVRSSFPHLANRRGSTFTRRHLQQPGICRMCNRGAAHMDRKATSPLVALLAYEIWRAKERGEPVPDLTARLAEWERTGGQQTCDWWPKQRAGNPTKRNNAIRRTVRLLRDWGYFEGDTVPDHILELVGITFQTGRETVRQQTLPKNMRNVRVDLDADVTRLQEQLKDVRRSLVLLANMHRALLRDRGRKPARS